MHAVNQTTSQDPKSMGDLFSVIESSPFSVLSRGDSDPENNSTIPDPLHPLLDRSQVDVSESGNLTDDLVRFIVDRATRTAIEAVTSCGLDNKPYWKMFFQQGLAHAIAEEKDLEQLFFEKLCGGIGLPFSADIIDGYLSTLPQPYLNQFLHDSLKKKSHPASKAFIGATYSTVEGRHFLRIVQVFFKHGLLLDPIGARLNNDLERAVCEGNEEFIANVIPKFTVIPTPLLIAIMNKSEDPARIVNLLVDLCGVPLEVFHDPKILAEAKPCARDYVIGLHTRRMNREAEQPIDRTDYEKYLDFKNDE